MKDSKSIMAPKSGVKEPKYSLSEAIELKLPATIHGEESTVEDNASKSLQSIRRSYRTLFAYTNVQNIG